MTSLNEIRDAYQKHPDIVHNMEARGSSVDMVLERIRKIPPDLLMQAHLRGVELGWKKEYVMQLLKDSTLQNEAPAGWQAQFRFPSGTTYEPHWICYHNSPRLNDETWNDYIKRCETDALKSFGEWTVNKNIVEESGLLRSPFITDEEKSKSEDYLYFLLYSHSIDDPVYIPPKNSHGQISKMGVALYYGFLAICFFIGITLSWALDQM